VTGTSQTSSPWERPQRFGYHETLRGLGGVVAPLLTGFSLATIAVLVTASDRPPLSDWAEFALGASAAALLFGMQTSFLALSRNPSPAEILSWQPETAVNDDELLNAREAQAATFANMTRLWNLSAPAYDAGITLFLFGLLFLLIPHAKSWSVAHGFAVAAVGIALLGEMWWALANRFDAIRHPVVRDVDASMFAGKLAPLDPVGRAAVLDPERREAAGLNE
jgi:hypothetical protein